MLFGAAIGSNINNIFIAIGLAILGHYFLDAFPHIEYKVDNIKAKLWKKAVPDFIKIFFDILIGLLLILFFSKNTFSIYICVFAAILPDMLSLAEILMPFKFFKKHSYFHREKIHFLSKHPAMAKKIPIYWKFLTQAVFLALSIFFLKV